MVVIFIGGILAVVFITHRVEEVGIRGNRAEERVVVHPVAAQRVIGDFVEVVARAVGIVVFVAIFIAHLSKPVVAQGFCIAHAHVVIPVFRRHEAILMEI